MYLDWATVEVTDKLRFLFKLYGKVEILRLKFYKDKRNYLLCHLKFTISMLGAFNHLTF